ncbi:hypothetical protein SteCoe_3917 [Stentor coeruleus]|uniref:Uncharacterized protein n=1 Tax=Stentor coeruleus TaxID=5963 RepID=A0A1R2CW53_9CILI|nr:hypothetical protein SteCoe_3917 [Stentor coeruleus]
MRKNYKNDAQRYLPESCSQSPNAFNERRIIHSNTHSPASTNIFLKVGIYAINNDKKRSILSVPKTKKKFAILTNENQMPRVRMPDLFQTENPTPLTQTNRAQDLHKTDSQEKKSYKFPITARYSLINTCRFRRNPNIENLKTALIEIEQKPIIKTSDIPTPIEQKKEYNDKSDIEKLIESQQINSRNASKNLKFPPKLDIKLIKQHKNTDDSNTQRSDPSPVREKKPQNNIERCSTSYKLHSKKPQPKNKHKLFTNKVDHEFYTKYYQNKLNISSSSSDPSSSSLDNSFKLIDYEKESLKILKNTSTFANKIMKGIRTSARTKY